MAAWIFDGMQAVPAVWLVTCMLLGSMAASFSGVAAWRLKRVLPHLLAGTIQGPEEKAASSLWARSHCEGCGRLLGFVDLIPVIGWLIRRGRCQECGKRIPGIYPLVEFAGACLFAAIGWWHGPGWTCVTVMLLCALLMAAAWVDWETYWVPDCFSMPCLFMGLYVSPFVGSGNQRLWGAAVAGGVMWLVMWLTGKWKGQDAVAWGDIILIGAGGAFLGLNEAVALMFVSCLLMLAYALPMRLWGLGKPTTELHAHMLEGADQASVPMGPAISAAIVLLSFHPHMMTMPLWELFGGID